MLGNMSSLEYMLTGIDGLDILLDGKGIPRSHIVLVLGGPGSGKTILGLQYIYEGVKRFDETGVILCLDESPLRVKAYAQNLGWDFGKLEQSKKVSFIDASPIRHHEGQVKIGQTTILIGKKEFSLQALLNMIETSAEQIGAKRMVVDPLTIFIVQYPDEAERRTVLLDLMEGIAKTGCTTLLVSELAESSAERAYQFEEYLVPGVLMMRRITKERAEVGVLQIEKMRGVNHDTQPHPYKISSNGIVVYPTEIVV